MDYLACGGKIWTDADGWRRCFCCGREPRYALRRPGPRNMHDEFAGVDSAIAKASSAREQVLELAASGLNVYQIALRTRLE